MCIRDSCSRARSPVAGIAPRSTIAKIEYDEDDPAEHDPDDPPDDGNGDAGDEEEDDGPDGEASGDELDDDEPLDDEERAWHRVWAEEPAVRPVAAAPR